MSPSEVSGGLVIAAAVAIVLAAAVQATTGFGFSIVAVPMLSGVLGVHDGVVLNLMLSLVTSLGVSLRTRRHANRAVMWPVVMGGAAGLAPGLLVFSFADVGVLRAAIAAAVVFAAVLLLLGAQVRLRRRPVTAASVGVMSGFLAGSVGLGGPPVTLYLNGMAWGKATYRASASLYFTALYLVLVPIHLVISGSLDLVVWAVVLSPAVVVGSWVGHHVFKGIDQLWFDRVVVLIVLTAGLAVLFGGTGG